MMYGFGLFGGLGMILFWGAFIWLVVWLIMQTKNKEKNDDTPMDILKKRFARGEITKKQYENMRSELQ